MEEYDPFMETSVSWQMKFTVWASVASFVMSFVPAMAFVLIGDWGGYLDAWAIRKDTKKRAGKSQARKPHRQTPGSVTATATGGIAGRMAREADIGMLSRKSAVRLHLAMYLCKARSDLREPHWA